MAPRSCTQQNFYVNSLANLTEQDKRTGLDLTKRSNVGNNEALTTLETFIPLKAPIPPLVLPLTNDFFTQFMKIFLKST